MAKIYLNQTFINGALTANFVDSNNLKIGNNLLENRFSLLNNKISYEILNLNFDASKIKCKNMLQTVNINDTNYCRIVNSQSLGVAAYSHLYTPVISDYIIDVNCEL